MRTLGADHQVAADDIKHKSMRDCDLVAMRVGVEIDWWNW